MMNQLPFYNLPLLLHVISGLLNGPYEGEESCFIRMGSPEPGAHIKLLDIYNSTAVVPLCSRTLLHPPPWQDGWVWRRHPQRKQTSPFSRIVSLWEGNSVHFFCDCEKFGINRSDWTKNSDWATVVYIEGENDCHFVACPLCWCVFTLEVTYQIHNTPSFREVHR